MHLDIRGVEFLEVEFLGVEFYNLNETVILLTWSEYMDWIIPGI